MKVNQEIRGGVCVLGVAGEVVADTAPRFIQAAHDALAAQQRDFIIDLGRVTTIDSAGLEALTLLQRECEEQLGMVRLCTADAVIRKILEMTRLDRVFEIHDDVAAALAAFQEVGVPVAGGRGVS